MSTEQSQDQGSQAQSLDDGSDESFVAKQRAAREPEQGEQVATTDPVATEPAVEQAEEVDQTNPDAEAELVEVEHEGKTYQVPKDLKDSLMRQTDYSRKTIEIAELKKQTRETLDLAVVSGEKLGEAIAAERIALANLQHYETAMSRALETNNFQEYAKLDIAYKKLERELPAIRAQRETLKTELTEGQKKTFAADRAAMFDELPKQIKGWNDEMGKQLTEYAKTNGISFDTLSKATDPGLIVAIDKARRFDELRGNADKTIAQASKPTATVRPGGVRPSTSNLQKLEQRYKQTGSEDDYTALLKARKKG